MDARHQKRGAAWMVPLSRFRGAARLGMLRLSVTDRLRGGGQRAAGSGQRAAGREQSLLQQAQAQAQAQARQAGGRTTRSVYKICRHRLSIASCMHDGYMKRHPPAYSSCSCLDKGRYMSLLLHKHPPESTLTPSVIAGGTDSGVLQTGSQPCMVPLHHSPIHQSTAPTCASLKAATLTCLDV